MLKFALVLVAVILLIKYMPALLFLWAGFLFITGVIVFVKIIKFFRKLGD